MKFNTLTGATALILSGMLIASCTNAKKAANKYDQGTTYTANPEVLELHGDSVQYEYTVDINPKALNKKTTVELNPTLVHEGAATPRPQVTIQGEKTLDKGNKEANTVQSKQGGKVVVQDKFAYEPSMKNSELKVEPAIMIKGNDEVQDQCYKLPSKTIAKGIITTALLMNDGEVSLESGDKYEPVLKNVDIELYYQINSSNFSPAMRIKSADINNRDQINKLKEMSKDTVYLVKGININGTASPDGELALNEKLSEKRSQSTFKYLTKELKRLGFDEVNDSAYSLNFSMTEDWNGWKNLVAASDLEDKDQILAIMNSSMNNEAKEAEIKRQHPKSYKKMADNMLPKLRRATVTFNRQTPLKTNEELMALSDSLDGLEPVELLQLARLYEKPEEKMRIYQHMVNKYPEDWRGYNNVAYVHLTELKPDEALPLLDKANSLQKDHAVILNNYGVAYAMKKDYVKAEQYYTQAKASGIEEDINMGMLQLRQGRYEEGIQMMKDKCAFNVGLAYTLKGDYESAKKSMECVKVEDRDANYYYLYSIVGARTNDLDMTTSNLTRSIQLDPEKREMAKSDLEFRKVKDRAEFQNALR